MKTCKTCKHWDTVSVGDRDRVSYGSYSPKRYCRLLSDFSDDTDIINEANGVEAAAQGVGGAAITTGPDFGCIHWSVSQVS